MRAGPAAAGNQEESPHDHVRTTCPRRRGRSSDQRVTDSPPRLPQGLSAVGRANRDLGVMVRRACRGYGAFMTARRASTAAVVMTVAAVGLMLLMIMFAARTGPQRIIHGTLRDPNIGAITPSFPTLAPLPTSTGHGRGGLHSNPFFVAVAWLVRGALVAVVLWLLWRVFQRLKEVVIDRRRPPPRPTHVEFDLLDDPEPLAEEIRKDASEQFALLLSGHPRNAIVACWDRFEEQAERVGAARRDWETSSEFTLRLLAAVAADHDSVALLEGLYREARFSDHAIDESHREAAVAALRSIHASLGAGAVSGR